MKSMSDKAFDLCLITMLGLTSAQLGALTNDDIYKYINPFVLCYWKMLLISVNGGLIALKGGRMIFTKPADDSNANQPKP